jgi:hypothetical protein
MAGMAYHTVEDGPWPVGTTVAAYPTSALVGGQPTGPPAGIGVASANGVVELGGLTEGVSYTAFGSSGVQEFVAINQEARLAALESAPNGGALNVTSTPYNVVPGITPAATATAQIELAMQAAAARAAAGGSLVEVEIPDGTYDLGTIMDPGGTSYEACVWLRSGVHLRMGRGTVLRLAAGYAAQGGTLQTHIVSCVKPYSSSTADRKTNCLVSLGTVDGNANNQTLTGGNPRVHMGLFFGGGRRMTAIGVQSRNLNGTAASPPGETFHFEANNCDGAVFTDCVADGTGATDTATGFSTDNSNDVAWSSCTARTMSHGMGFTCWQSSSLRWTACKATGCVTAGFNAERSEDLIYNGCSAGGRSPLIGNGNPQSPWFTGGQVTLANGDGFRVFGCTDVTLNGCHALYNTGEGLWVASNTAGSDGTRVSSGVLVNGGSYSSNGLRGIHIATLQVDVHISPRTRVRSNTSGQVLYDDGSSDTTDEQFGNAPIRRFTVGNTSSGLRDFVSGYSGWVYRLFANGSQNELSDGDQVFGVDGHGRAAFRDQHALTTGFETMSRLDAVAGVGMTSQALRLTYFTAPRSKTITKLGMVTTSTAAAATPTLIRLGLYTVAGNGDLTLVASTANDTTLLSATNTRYDKALSASYALVAGQRYALGALVVTSATVPNLMGVNLAVGTEAFLDPRMSAVVFSQADLPASISNATLGNTTSMPYFVLTP